MQKLKLPKAKLFYFLVTLEKKGVITSEEKGILKDEIIKDNKEILDGVKQKQRELKKKFMAILSEHKLKNPVKKELNQDIYQEKQQEIQPEKVPEKQSDKKQEKQSEKEQEKQQEQQEDKQQEKEQEKQKEKLQEKQQIKREITRINQINAIQQKSEQQLDFDINFQEKIPSVIKSFKLFNQQVETNLQDNKAQNGGTYSEGSSPDSTKQQHKKRPIKSLQVPTNRQLQYYQVVIEKETEKEADVQEEIKIHENPIPKEKQLVYNEKPPMVRMETIKLEKNVKTIGAFVDYFNYTQRIVEKEAEQKSYKKKQKQDQ